MIRIDLRSDTVTRPDREMLEAMMNAEVGDDVYGEDPTINRLEEYVASMLGKERAIFVPTGVMSNQLCLKTLTKPGDEVILGARSHIFNYEAAAPALLSGVQLHTVPDEDGIMRIEDIDWAVREDEYHLPPTSVIAIEQTHNRGGGVIVPMNVIDGIVAYARERGISLHLDGARLWNACAATGIAPADYASRFDTVSVCLSKGLGAPVGSVMASTAERIDVARKFRKIWGGGWRQAGILAAAGLHALEHNFPRLAEDHEKARRFAEIISTSEFVDLPAAPDTNIVVFALKGIDLKELSAAAAERGVLLSGAFRGRLRAAFHRDIDRDGAERAGEMVLEALDRLAVAAG